MPLFTGIDFAMLGIKIVEHWMSPCGACVSSPTSVEWVSGKDLSSNVLRQQFVCSLYESQRDLAASRRQPLLLLAINTQRCRHRTDLTKRSKIESVAKTFVLCYWNPTLDIQWLWLFCLNWYDSFWLYCQIGDIAFDCKRGSSGCQDDCYVGVPLDVPGLYY